MSVTELNTEQRYSSESDKLLLKWPSIDQKYWLQTQLGLEFDSLTEGLANKSGDIESIRNLYNNTFRPGFVPNTVIDPYRNWNISGITFSELQQNVNTLILSLFNDSYSGSLDTNHSEEYLRPEIDAGKIINTVISDTQFHGIFAPFSSWINVSGRDFSLTDTLATGAKWINNSFTKAQINNLYLDEVGDTNVDGQAVVTNCQFRDCNINIMRIGRADIRNLFFDNSKLINLSLRGNLDHNGIDAVFSDVKGYCDINGKIIIDNSKLYNSFFNVAYNPASFSGVSEPPLPSDEPLADTQKNLADSERPLLFSSEGNNEMRFCKIYNSIIYGNWKNTDFTGTDFYDSANSTTTTFNQNADISGADFRESTIDQVYATKADLVNAVLSAEGAIWVDGTSVT